ncbi:hypothetical protein AB0M28_05825 [Streptomyces sp. NPDC051940]|uniref:hypothetical protein n=1 Tax=Streptomyces sp. NPDC051940 TaxID=3155675 RepID=UPI00342AC297
MSESTPGFLDELLWRHFGPEFGSSPQMRRAEVEKLLTDDGQRRLELAERAAVDWGRAENSEDVRITSERVVITPRGLLYAARLQGSPQPQRKPYPEPLIRSAGQTSACPRRHPLYYLATPHASFDQLIDRVDATQLRWDSTAAVDCRFGHDLEFPWPLDTALRRTMDSHPVFIWL